MNDTVLLFTGAGVFALMLVGIIFTIVEFRNLNKQDRRRNSQSDKPTVER